MIDQNLKRLLTYAYSGHSPAYNTVHGVITIVGIKRCRFPILMSRERRPPRYESLALPDALTKRRRREIVVRYN